MPQTRTSNECVAILNDGYMLIKNKDTKRITQNLNVWSNGIEDILLQAVINHHLVKDEVALEIITKNFNFYKQLLNVFMKTKTLPWSDVLDNTNKLINLYENDEKAQEYCRNIAFAILDDFEGKDGKTNG